MKKLDYSTLKYLEYITITPNGFKINDDCFNSDVLDRMKEDADEGDASAQFLIGEGLSCAKMYNEAFVYLKASANQGFAPAENWLAQCFFAGDGTEADEDSGKLWMSYAANDGDASATLFLGCHFDESDVGVEPFEETNDRTATFWYYFGAKQGNAQCMNNLAMNFANGIGLPRNDFLARYWMRKAADNGCSSSIPTANAWGRYNDSQMELVEKQVYRHRIIKFGSYPQKEGFSKEPIEWIVCAESDDLMILISKSVILKTRFYDQESVQNNNNSWATSYLRRYLNTEFLKEAFTQSEQQRLLVQNSYNEPNPIYLNSFMGESKDLISIPCSFDLVNRLNLSEWKCDSVPRMKLFSNETSCSWWIRNEGEPGSSHDVSWATFHGYNVITVDEEGFLDCDGTNGSLIAGVRPMITIKKIKKAKENNHKNVESDVQQKSKEWISSGKCQYCGGDFKGFFKKKCAQWGKPKDY